MIPKAAAEGDKAEFGRNGEVVVLIGETPDRPLTLDSPGATVEDDSFGVEFPSSCEFVVVVADKATRALPLREKVGIGDVL